MKDNTISIRTGEADKENLQKAAENLSVLTDEKPSLSKAIRAGVKILAETDPNKPDLFYVNRKALRELETNLEYGRRSLQSIVDQYEKALGFYPTIEDINSWFGANTSNFLVVNENLVREKILLNLFETQQSKNPYPGFKFTYDNIIVPDITELLEACHQLIFIPEISHRDFMSWESFQIVAGKVELVPDHVNEVKNAYRLYASTPAEKTRLAEVRKLCAVMDDIKLTNVTKISIPGVIFYDDEAGVFAPHENYVKGYLK